MTIKRLLTLLLLLCPLASQASLVVSNNDVMTFNGSSYDIPLAWGAIVESYFALKYPSKTNYFFTVSRGGEGWLGWYQSEEEKWALPFWASGTSQVRNIYATDDNGGLTSNNIVDVGTNIANAPQLFWNGTAVTNEGYDFPIQFLFTGNTIHDSSDGDSGGISRNSGSIWLNGHYSTPVVDEWHMLWTNGWSSDATGSRKLGFATGSHPYQAGLLAMSVTTLTALGADTNYGYTIFDWDAVTATTNQSCVVSLTKTGNSMSCTIRFDCMPPGFMYQAGNVTNDSTAMFSAMPIISQWFQWIVRGTNFPSQQTFNLSIDGTLVDSCTGASLNTGRNWFTNTVGPLWSQRLSVYNAVLDLYGLDHTTLAFTHSAGSPGVLGVGDMINYFSHTAFYYDNSGHRGSQYVSDVASDVVNCKKYIAAAYTVAQPTSHTLTITVAQSASVTTTTSGTVHFGL